MESYSCGNQRRVTCPVACYLMSMGGAVRTETRCWLFGAMPDTCELDATWSCNGGADHDLAELRLVDCSGPKRI